MPSINTDIDTNAINDKLDKILANQDNIMLTLSQNSKKIHGLEQENIELKSKVNLLSENFTRLDQYSRKSVMIITGIKKDENETPDGLRHKVVGKLNTVLNADKHLNLRDFVDIHRNSKFGKAGKPPSITAKFIRYTDKNLFFNRTVANLRKTRLPGVGFFHNMCPDLIEVQNKIQNHDNIKFVRFEGDNRFFTVCVECDGNNTMIKYIKCFKQFKIEYNKWYSELDI